MLEGSEEPDARDGLRPQRGAVDGSRTPTTSEFRCDKKGIKPDRARMAQIFTRMSMDFEIIRIVDSQPSKRARCPTFLVSLRRERRKVTYVNHLHLTYRQRAALM